MLFEEFEITITGATGSGSFKVQFFNPLYDPDNRDSILFWVGENIADNCSGGELASNIQPYFSAVWGSNIHVLKVDYDENDTETSDSTLVVKSIYTV